MRQNNNQQQNSSEQGPCQLAPIHESSLTKKVLQLEYQIQKTQKCYHVVKKPIKYFSKVKRSLPDSKNSQHQLQVGVLSEKVIPPNIGEHLSYAQKPHVLQNPKLKNVFQAYKETLEEKYRKKRRLMEKAALKISVGKIHQTEAASEQMIQEKEELIKKRLSSKRLDPNMINSHQPSPMHKSKLLQSVRQKQCSSRLLDTIDDASSNHNFVRSSVKRPQVSIVIPHDHYLSNKQVSIYQVKKKCYSEERENMPIKSNELNKTRNICFRLPSEKKKSHKHFIERLGGQTYNLPEINDKVANSSDTISYLIKSLRRPSETNHFKGSYSNVQIDQNVKVSESVERVSLKERNKRIKTLELENESSIFEEQEDSNLLGCSGQEKDGELIKSNKNSSRYQIKHRKARRKLAKFNIMGNIDGWNTSNELPEIQSHLMHHFVSLEPTQTTFDY